jgi:protein-S-isoprenylcysteine O-methyltransferase Ste14
MVLNHRYLSVLWVVFCALHSLLASIRVKKWAQKKNEKSYRYYRLFYTVFAALSLAAVVYYQVSMESVYLYQRSLVSNIGGGFVAALGISLMLVCIKKYFLSLSGIKSLYREEEHTAELMIAGIHRYMRHPLYLGTFLFLWGLWLLFPTVSLLLANIVITGYTLYAIRLEEEKLVAEFGEQYKRYQQQVPKLIPRF